MQIKTLYSSDPGQDPTKPYPDKNGIFFAMRSGDMVYPLGSGTNTDGSSRWFNAPYFKYVIRCKWTVGDTLLLWFCVLSWGFLVSHWFLLLFPFVPGPYVAYRFGNYFGYWGSKAFGVDHEEYGHWMCDPSDVFPGSLALMLISIRPFGKGN